MVINEKPLVKLMNQRFKGAGYTVAVSGQRIWLIGPNWAVWSSIEQLPRKVLGALAEHMGKLPGAGTAYKPSKNMGCQSEIYETATTETETMVARVSEEGIRLFRTQLTFQGYDLWQAREQLRMVMIDPDLMAMAKPKEQVRYAGGWCGIADGESGVYISAQGRAAIDDNRLAHLEGFQFFTDK